MLTSSRAAPTTKSCQRHLERTTAQKRLATDVPTAIAGCEGTEYVVERVEDSLEQGVQAMAKKSARKPSGAAGIKVIEDDLDDATDDLQHETNGSRSDSAAIVAKPGRKVKAKVNQQASGHFGVSEIKKAAAFANSIGGLDKAIAILQILKIAKEVQ
jgi:hypothetical protein